MGMLGRMIRSGGKALKKPAWEGGVCRWTGLIVTEAGIAVGKDVWFT
jgi:hypothetical protein